MYTTTEFFLMLSILLIYIHLKLPLALWENITFMPKCLLKSLSVFEHTTSNFDSIIMQRYFLLFMSFSKRNVFQGS